MCKEHEPSHGDRRKPHRHMATEPATGCPGADSGGGYEMREEGVARGDIGERGATAAETQEGGREVLQ